MKRFFIFILCVGFGLAFAIRAQASSCEDLFALRTGFDALTAPPQAEYLNHLEKFVGRLYENFTFPLPDYGKGNEYTQFSYPGRRLVKHEGAIYEGVGLRAGVYELPNEVIVDRQIYRQSLRRVHPKSIAKPGVTYEISKKDLRLYAISDRSLETSASRLRYTLAALNDAITITATDRFLYVLEVGQGPGRRTSVLKEYSLPITLPQRRPISMKAFDLSDTIPRDYSPILFPYGRFLLLGGKEVMLLDPALNAVLHLKMAEDDANSTVVAFADLGRGLIQILRRNENARPRSVITSTVLDISKLKIPLRR